MNSQPNTTGKQTDRLIVLCVQICLECMIFFCLTVYTLQDLLIKLWLQPSKQLLQLCIDRPDTVPKKIALVSCAEGPTVTAQETLCRMYNTGQPRAYMHCKMHN